MLHLARTCFSTWIPTVEVNSLLPATPGRGRRAHSKNNYMSWRNWGRKTPILFSWGFLTSTQSSSHTPSFLDLVSTSSNSATAPKIMVTILIQSFLIFFFFKFWTFPVTLTNAQMWCSRPISVWLTAVPESEGTEVVDGKGRWVIGTGGPLIMSLLYCDSEAVQRLLHWNLPALNVAVLEDTFDCFSTGWMALSYSNRSNRAFSIKFCINSKMDVLIGI